MKYGLAVLAILLLFTSPVKAALTAVNSTLLSILTAYSTTNSTYDLVQDSRINAMDAAYTIQGGNSTPTATPAPGTSFGLLPNGQRDKLKWPFAVTSAWNTPIGSNAVYKAAGVTRRTYNGAGWQTRFRLDEDIIIFKPNSPLIAAKQNYVGWDGGDRCSNNGDWGYSLPVPSNYVVPNSGENNSTGILMADGHTLKLNQPFTRCADNGVPRNYVTFGWPFSDQDIYGDGHLGGHGGSRLSAVGGTIRLGEFPSGSIKHVMKVNLYAMNYYYKNCTWHWPAETVDGYCQKGQYGGTDPDFTPGSLLALKPSFNVAGLRTEPGRILAKAFQDYGAYVVDDTYWNAWALITEQGPDGKVADEFETKYKFKMCLDDDTSICSSLTSQWGLDIKDIYENLNIITNNSSSNRGGGGTPRAPMAPAIGN